MTIYRSLTNMSRTVLVISSLLFAGLAMAQQEAESRQAVVTGTQEEKAGELKPPQPDRVEALVRKFEKIFLETPSGFYPLFSSVYHGGGLTLGGGYRRFYGDNTSWNVQGLYSFKNYKL